MSVPTNQQLVREFITLLLHRGMRHAAVDSNDIFKVKIVDTGVAAGTVPASKTWAVIELDDATIISLDEKAFSMDHPHVPDITRP